MSTKCVFLCGVDNIIIKDDLGDGLVLLPHEKSKQAPKITLTNNRSKIQSLLSHELPFFLGAIEYNHLRNGYPLVAYSESEFDENKVTPIEHLGMYLSLLKMYFLCVWLVKDNAADFDIGYLIFSGRGGETMVSSNTMTSTNFKCDGTRSFTEFSKEELVGASQYLANNIALEFKVPKFANAMLPDRASIANYFVQSGRSTHDLGIKTVGYCSALETLFSNGENTELSHKLSERISKFLEKDLANRIALYKAVKKIYEIRSKIVHGATYKSSKVPELTGLVGEADDICRRVLQYSFLTPEDTNIFDKPKDDLEKYFVELILG